MPTSATGRSSKPRAACSSGRAGGRLLAGFTLLEVLVVLVIIGIITSMAVLSTRVLGGDHEMDQEARRLQAVLTEAREEALLDGRDVGMRLDEHGYDFVRYNGRLELWEPAGDDPLFRERLLPDGMNAALMLEARDVPLKPRAADVEPDEDDTDADRSETQRALAPQVVVQASGDLVPFEIVLNRDGTDERRRIAGTLDGAIAVSDDTDGRR